MRTVLDDAADFTQRNPGAIHDGEPLQIFPVNLAVNGRERRARNANFEPLHRKRRLARFHSSEGYDQRARMHSAFDSREALPWRTTLRLHPPLAEIEERRRRFGKRPYLQPAAHAVRAG